MQSPDRSIVCIDRLNDFKVDKWTVSDGKLFQIIINYNSLFISTLHLHAMLPFPPRRASDRTRRCTARRGSCTGCRWWVPARRRSKAQPRWTGRRTDWTPGELRRPDLDTEDSSDDCSQTPAAPAGSRTASVTSVCACGNSKQNRVPTLLLTKKIQDFPGPPRKIFQDLFGARECLNVKKTGIYLQYSECSPLQKIQHEAKCGRKNARLSRIFFQDFPGPGIFKIKMQDFPGGVGTLRKTLAHVFIYISVEDV